MRKHDRIEINPDIMFGKPVIRNTRITVEHILRKLAGGMTSEEIIIDHRTGSGIIDTGSIICNNIIFDNSAAGNGAINTDPLSSSPINRIVYYPITPRITIDSNII